jgi:hypothetical protein
MQPSTPSDWLTSCSRNLATSCPSGQEEARRAARNQPRFYSSTELFRAIGQRLAEIAGYWPELRRGSFQKFANEDFCAFGASHDWSVVP